MHELLIIGPDAWGEALARFSQYKQDTGIPSKVVTLQEAETEPGSDLPDRIKRRIEREHRVNGVKYVLLVGDSDQFPVRYIRAVNTEWGTNWYASDLYYADLYDTAGASDDWDADGDGVYAEMDFKEGASGAKFNIDKVNLRPDVAVGRVPASTLEEAQRYFDKVRAYEFCARESQAYGYPSDWFRDAVFASGPGFGAESDNHAVPLTAAGFRVTRLSEDDALWKASLQRHQGLRDRLNAGVGFLHFSGHGLSDLFQDWFTLPDVATLANEHRLPIVIAMSCLTAKFHFDRDKYLTAMGTEWIGSQGYVEERPAPAPTQTHHDKDSMAEEFLVRRDSGAIAYLGATCKYEWGGKTLGSYFLEAYRDAPKPPTLGSLWQSALTRFVATDLGGGTTGMGPYYAFIHAHKVMLFGDPSLRVGGLAHHAWPSIPGPLQPDLIHAALR